MNPELFSNLLAVCFCAFLTVQYSIFLIFSYGNQEMSHSRKEIGFIIVTGGVAGLSALFSILDDLAVKGSPVYFLFYRANLISGVLAILLYIFLLRQILIMVKDMTYVETDAFKAKSRKHNLVYALLSAGLIGLIAFYPLHEAPLYSGLTLFDWMIVLFLTLTVAVEAREFLKVMRLQMGKLSLLNRTRYKLILSGGVVAVVFTLLEFLLIVIGKQSWIDRFGSPFAYGIALAALSLSLNLVFEYLDAVKRANEANRKLSEMNRQMMEDVRTAQSLQISLLPLDKQKEIQKLIDMEISYMPMQSVGGDYYDYYQLNEDQVLLFLGDASGHGVYAAMIWAMLKVEVEELIEAHKFSNLAHAFTLLNERITRILENTYSYATLFACLIDLRQKKVDYISAGHTDQLYFESEAGEVKRIRNKNPIIGTFKNVKFTSETIPYQVNDCILMYSDGIVEGTNPDGEQLGRERLTEMFREVSSGNGGNASKIIGKLLMKLEDFFEGTLQKDDRTIMVIKL